MTRDAAHTIAILAPALLALFALACRSKEFRQWLLFHPVRRLTIILLFCASRAALGCYHRTREPRHLFRARRITDRLIQVRCARRPSLLRRR